MRRLLAAISPLMLLSACGFNGTDREAGEGEETASTTAPAGADSGGEDALKLLPEPLLPITDHESV